MNTLKHSKSLYLQQHAHNPVNWKMWGEAAFQQAAAEDKPILVSIGYAACHWCHVMERESFENPAIAALMNKYFICIKVDREEHPAVDHLYMDAIQAMRQQGGWPLNIFVTPEKKPFYGGTYFPPRPVYGRPSWQQVLEGIQHLWLNERDNITQQSDQLFMHLQQVSQSTETTLSVEDFQAEVVAGKIMEQADETYGGFGLAPKFPSTMLYQYLIDYGVQSGDDAPVTHVLFSLEKMLLAGIYDKVHGGLCRYATDEAWMVPHFEKMLYDNALFVSVLSKAYKYSPHPLIKQGIVQTIDFCMQFLYTGAGFKSAIDADSEGVEGKYYTYDWDALKALNIPDVEELLSYYNCSPAGNWEGVNILHADTSVAQYAVDNVVDGEALARNNAALMDVLKRESLTRVLPAIDDKLQLSWNALMNAALSDAYAALGDVRYIELAKQHMLWMQSQFESEGKLYHIVYESYQIPANADDWAYLIAALIRLAEVSGLQEYWHQAATLYTAHSAQFIDETGLFYYFSSKEDTNVPIRKIELHDTALPSVNAVMAQSLQKLGLVFVQHEWMDKAWTMHKKMQAMIIRYPNAFGQWIQGALHLDSYATLQIVGAGAKEVLRAVNAKSPAYIIPIIKESKEDNLPCIAHKDLVLGEINMYECSKDSCSVAYKSIAQWLEKKC